MRWFKPVWMIGIPSVIFIVTVGINIAQNWAFLVQFFGDMPWQFWALMVWALGSVAMFPRDVFDCHEDDDEVDAA